MRKKHDKKSEISRREFVSATGAGTIAGIAGTTLAGCVSLNTCKDKPIEVSEKRLFSSSLATTTEDRMEQVKIALLAMQHYNWEIGVAAQAMLEMGEDDWVIALSQAAIMRQEEGRFSVIGEYSPVTDAASVGEAVLYAGKLTGDPIFKEAANKMMKVILTTDHKNSDGILYHTQEPTKRIMSDAFYMAPPFIAAAGYYEEAIKQIEGFRKALWSEEDHLYSHIWDDVKQKFERKDYWGFGNGWTAAGLCRVIKMLPENMSNDRNRLIKYVGQLIDGCLVYLRDDGLFHNVINDPNSFVEVNLSQAISYSIYRGVAGGWLNSSYLTSAEKMRKAANAKVDRYGLVRDVCGVPDFNRPNIAPEGQAFYLLMETAARDLAKNGVPKELSSCNS